MWRNGRRTGLKNEKLAISSFFISFLIIQRFHCVYWSKLTFCLSLQCATFQSQKWHKKWHTHTGISLSHQTFCCHEVAHSGTNLFEDYLRSTRWSFVKLGEFSRRSATLKFVNSVLGKVWPTSDIDRFQPTPFSPTPSGNSTHSNLFKPFGQANNGNPSRFRR